MTARPILLPALAFVAILASASAAAQTTSPAPAAPAPAPPAPAADASPAPLVESAAPSQRVPDAKIEHLVTEDSQVRIEETRVRGVTKKIVVHSKIPGMGSYEIQPADPGVDPSQDHAAGKRLFNFGF